MHVGRNKHHFLRVPGTSTGVAAAGILPYILTPDGETILALLQIEDMKAAGGGWSPALALLGGKVGDA